MRSARNDHSVERIGKKYQWLALYELVARLEDNCEPLPDRDDDRLRLRNLDPSLLVERTHDGSWRSSDEKPFWIGQRPGAQARDGREAIAWLDSAEDVLDGIGEVAVTSPSDEREWLVLKGFESWRTPGDERHCDTWRRIACCVVHAADLDVALETLAGVQMTGPHDVPTANGGGLHIHLGEFPWRWLQADQDEWHDEWKPHELGRRGKAFAIRPTTADYLAEANEYDGSIADSVNLQLPTRWLMQGLGLRLADGRSIVYKDSEGRVLFMDPSVLESGRSAALVDRAAFLDLLDREGLVAIWRVAGEKAAYGASFGGGFAGRYSYTRLMHSDGRNVTVLKRSELCLQSMDR